MSDTREHLEHVEDVARRIIREEIYLDQTHLINLLFEHKVPYFDEEAKGHRVNPDKWPPSRCRNRLRNAGRKMPKDAHDPDKMSRADLLATLRGLGVEFADDTDFDVLATALWRLFDTGQWGDPGPWRISAKKTVVYADDERLQWLAVSGTLACELIECGAFVIECDELGQWWGRQVEFYDEVKNVRRCDMDPVLREIARNRIARWQKEQKPSE